MRLIVDLQGAQTPGSAERGVGRYTRSLTAAMLAEAGDHEIILALNGSFPETFDTLRRSFACQVPHERIRAWRMPALARPGEAPVPWRTRAGECLREDFLAGLRPDAVHVSSLFEGFRDSAVTSIGMLAPSPPTGSMLFDLTPIAHADTILSNDSVRHWYKEKLAHLKRARLWLAVSESTRREAVEWLGLPAERVVNVSAGVSETFFAEPPSAEERAAIMARHRLERPFILYYGGFDPHKNLHRLLEGLAMAQGPLPVDHDVMLAGPVPAGLRAELEEHARRHGLGADRLQWPGHVPDRQLIDLLRCCAVFVFPSLREGFGLPVLEAMAAGAPAICSGTTSLPEIRGLEEAMFDPRAPASIARVLVAVLTDDRFRSRLQSHGRARAGCFSWRTSARRTLAVYEALHAEVRARGRSAVVVTAPCPPAGDPRDRLAALASLVPPRPANDGATDPRLWELAASIAANRTPQGPRRLLVDVTFQSLGQPGSGIARVVNQVTAQLLRHPPEGVVVEPVRAAQQGAGPFVHARRHAATLRGEAAQAPPEEPLELRVGDHFLALDLNHALPAHSDFLDRLKEIGGRRSAVVYDLLPLQRPDWFPPGLAEAHREWFATLAGLDRLVCISRAVADEVRHELSRLAAPVRHPQVTWFHLGSELPEPPAGELPPALTRRPSILLVSVLYARKGHLQALEAFERLWSAGAEINLVFAGRVGWGVDALVERLRSHPERGRRLFWFDGPDDALLGRLYGTAAGVLIASEGEGFGLPLVEALRHRRPVLARDLPVFRELVGDGIRYFDTSTAAGLAGAVQGWLADMAAGRTPPAAGYTPLSWNQSARQLLRALA